ncbi:hypothetical protein H7F15_16065 [Pontibacter sp. Tf4]|uniref:hypothetical protein n=1 Tax=Pontibacter sp. Tf4 TaxID=2761620 RepID=UPI001626CDB2|nr:hypothetical protein [Pontibacter sp. Tf4]MBB6612561.1 hypothetical protein [Pontibacter sp. Tf4]
MHLDCKITYNGEPFKNAVAAMYWTTWPWHSRRFGFTYSIDTLAQMFHLDHANVIQIALAASSVIIKCKLCSNEIALSSRDELEELQYRFNGYHVMCTTCESELHKQAETVQSLFKKEQSLSRALISQAPGRQECYERLVSLFPRVFAAVSPVAFIDSTQASRTMLATSEKDLFYSTRFSFIVCGNDNYPIAALDYPVVYSKTDWERKYTFKKRLLNTISLPYYVFPQDEQNFFSEEVDSLLKMEELRTRLIKTDMLAAAAYITQPPAF